MTTGAASGDATGEVAVDGPLDVRRTLSVLRQGAGDPTFRVRDGEVWRAARTPDGPGTIAYRLEPGPGGVAVRAWGPGAGWLVSQAPAALGVHDDPSSFRPDHPLVDRLHRAALGRRLPDATRVMHALVPIVLGQKVIAAEAATSYERLVYRFSDRAPGPGRVWLPPDPDRLAALPYWEYHRVGVEKKRADIVRRVAAAAATVEAAVGERRGRTERVERALSAIRGVGPWTISLVQLTALGEPDAVIVGDYKVPSTITWALAGERDGDDERMLELLAPFADHRGRVQLLLKGAGPRRPRRGPKTALRHVERH